MWAVDLNSFELTDGVLKIAGTESADAIQVTQSATTLTVTRNETTQEYSLADVDLIEIRSGAGDDVVVAGNSVTVPLHIWAGAGNDTIEGGKGADWLFGEAGDDTLHGRHGNDYLSGGDGEDTLLGGNGKDTLFGDADNDYLDGGYHSDRLRGGDGDDVLLGGAAADALTGGAGLDIITPGTGTDKIFEGQKVGTRAYGPQRIDAIIYDEPGERSETPLTDMPTLGELTLGEMSLSSLSTTSLESTRFDSLLVRHERTTDLEVLALDVQKSELSATDDELTFGNIEQGLAGDLDGEGGFSLMSMGEYGEYGGDYGDYGGGGDYGDYGDKGIWIENIDEVEVMQLSETYQQNVPVFVVNRWGNTDEEVSFQVTLEGEALDTEFGGDYVYNNGYTYTLYLGPGESSYAIDFHEIFDDNDYEGNESINAELHDASIAIAYEDDIIPDSDPDSQEQYAYARIIDDEYPDIDIDVDSNNDGTIDSDNEGEDEIEMNAPGHYLAIYDTEASEVKINDPFAYDSRHFKVEISYTGTASFWYEASMDTELTDFEWEGSSEVPSSFYVSSDTVGDITITASIYEYDDYTSEYIFVKADLVALQAVDATPNIIIHNGQSQIEVSESAEDSLGAFTIANRNDSDGDGKIDNVDDYVKGGGAASGVPIDNLTNGNVLTVSDVSAFKPGDTVNIAGLNGMEGVENNRKIVTITEVMPATNPKTYLVTLDKNITLPLLGPKMRTTGANEVDLIKVILKKPTQVLANKTLDLTVTASAIGNIKFWKNSWKGEEAFTLTNGTRSFSQAEINAFDDGGYVVWMESKDASAALKDIVLTLKYGGNTDTAVATAIWSTVTAKYADQATAAVYAGPVWGEVPENDVVRKLITDKYMGTGVLPILPAYGIRNMIVMQFKITPDLTGLPEVNPIKIDASRIINRTFYGRDDSNQQWGDPKSKVSLPYMADLPNDDKRNTDESKDLIAGQYWYSADAPGIGVVIKPPGSFNQEAINFNGMEFLRINIDNTSPLQGENVWGSRSSDFFNWHSTMLIQADANGVYSRIGGPTDNEIKPGHIQVE